MLKQAQNLATRDITLFFYLTLYTLYVIPSFEMRVAQNHTAKPLYKIDTTIITYHQI